MKGGKKKKAKRDTSDLSSFHTLTIMKASNILALCGLFVLLALPAILANTCGVHSPFCLFI
jgi:hypothetical protein